MLDEHLHPAFLYLGLLSLAVLLVGIRIQHGSIFRPIRENLLYRLFLATIAGWVGACVLWFSVLEPLGIFVPGLLFGVLVMLPMLDHPERHPFRVVVLAWAAMIAHAAIWFTGILLIDMVGYEPIKVGAPAGVVFGVIVFLAISRILNLRFNRPVWFIAILISMICGTIYAGIILEDWFGWVSNFKYFNLEDSPIFFIYILWYAATAAVFHLGKPYPRSPITKYDFSLLGGLVLITILEVLWLNEFF